MKKSIFLSALLSLFVFRSPVTAQSNDKAAIEKFIHAYFDALNASDATKTTAAFAENGVLLAQGAPTAVGNAQINGAYNYVFSNFKYTVEETIGEIIVQGNYAIVSSTSKGTFTIKAKNETIPGEFRETFILQKVNGAWKIARYMFNQPN